MYAGYKPYKTVEEEVGQTYDPWYALSLTEGNKYQWLTLPMREVLNPSVFKVRVEEEEEEEEFKNRYENDVVRAQGLLGAMKGYESVLEYITDCHSRGIMLSSDTLKDFWDEFWSYHRDEEVENEVNSMIEANA